MVPFVVSLLSSHIYDMMAIATVPRLACGRIRDPDYREILQTFVDETEIYLTKTSARSDMRDFLTIRFWKHGVCDAHVLKITPLFQPMTPFIFFSKTMFSINCWIVFGLLLPYTGIEIACNNAFVFFLFHMRADLRQL